MNMEQMRKGTSRGTQFSLSTMLCLTALILPSIGVVRTIDLSTFRMITLRGSNWTDDLSMIIASKMGGLSTINRIFFVRAIFEESLTGLIIAIFVLLLLRVNLSWSRAMALSLIFAIPAEAIISCGGGLHPMTLTRLSIYFKVLFMPSIMCLILMAFFLFAKRCVVPAAGAKTITHWNVAQWLVHSAIVMIYLSISAYGWNDIHKFHADWLKGANARERQVQTW